MEQTLQYNLLLAASLQMSFGIKKLPIKAEKLLDNFRRSEIPPIVYIKGKSCSGCSISIINYTNQSPSKLIINHEDLLTPKGYASPHNLAIELIKRYVAGKLGPYFFALEGGIPINPLDCYMANYPLCHWVKNAGKTAIASLSIGNCATFGSPEYSGNSNDKISLNDFYSRHNIANRIINITGCPVTHESIWNVIIDLINCEQPSYHLAHQKEFASKNI